MRSINSKFEKNVKWIPKQRVKKFIKKTFDYILKQYSINKKNEQKTNLIRIHRAFTYKTAQYRKTFFISYVFKKPC